MSHLVRHATPVERVRKRASGARERIGEDYLREAEDPNPRGRELQETTGQRETANVLASFVISTEYPTVTETELW